MWTVNVQLCWEKGCPPWVYMWTVYVQILWEKGLPFGLSLQAPIGMLLIVDFRLD